VGVSGCVSGSGPIVVPPPTRPVHTLTVSVRDAAGLAVPGVYIRILDNQNAGREAVTTDAGLVTLAGLWESGFTFCATKEGYREAAGRNGCRGVTLVADRAEDLTFERIAAPARPGQVRAVQHLLLDDAGPRLWWGTSLFWSLWGELHDQAKLEANLVEASRAGAQFIRVFAQVGGASWADRAVDPLDPRWAAGIQKLTDRAYDKHGLRVEWTLFAWANNLTAAQERAAVDAFAGAMEGRQHKVFATEIANEGFTNGPEPADAKALAARLRARFHGLIATTAPKGDSCLAQAPWYRGSGATIITLHLQRSTSGEGKMWRPVRQPWRESTFQCDGQAGAYINNEPIGPGSSVAEDADPLRIVMQAVVSWIGGMAAYVYHTDAGIRGGGFADRERGRKPDLWLVDNWHATTRGLEVASGLLPADVPNWQRAASKPIMFDVETFQGPSNPTGGTVDRIYCAWKASEFVCGAFNIVKATRLTARRALTVAVHHPLTAVVLQEVTLAKGQAFTIAASPAAVILVGRFQ